MRGMHQFGSTVLHQPGCINNAFCDSGGKATVAGGAGEIQEHTNHGNNNNNHQLHPVYIQYVIKIIRRIEIYSNQYS